jgi:hypothetical protein
MKDLVKPIVEVDQVIDINRINIHLIIIWCSSFGIYDQHYGSCEPTVALCCVSQPYWSYVWTSLIATFVADDLILEIPIGW